MPIPTQQDNNLKILIASILPVKKEVYWSGINAAIHRQLSVNHTVETSYSPRAHRIQRFLSTLSNFRFKLFGHRSNVYFNSIVSQIYAKQLAQDEKTFNPDLILVLGSGTELYAYKPRTTTYLVADANFYLLNNTYTNYSNLSESAETAARKVEQKSLANFDTIFFTSEWALLNTADHYPELTPKLKRINFGSNLRSEGLEEKETPHSEENTQLLTVGLDYYRKGIDRATRLRTLLNAKLTVIGIDVKLNKENKSELDNLTDHYKAAHFFVLLSRADCTPIVINEANSVGLPVIVSNVGGMSSIVSEGINGFVVKTEEEAATILKKYIANPTEYTALRKSTYEYYTKNLTWTKFEDTLMAIYAKKP